MKRNKTINAIIFNISCLILAIVMMYPVLWLVSSSFKDNKEIFNNSGSLIPGKMVFYNYLEGWKGFGKTTFATFFKNSLVISVLSTAFTVFSSAFVAFGFARIKFRGQKLWFGIMILTIMLPYQVLMIPQYIIFNKLGWLNTFLPLIIPKLMGVPFFIFLMMQFIQTIPRELDEAAVIDGCNQFYIFGRIIVPLMAPAVFTSAIFQFYWSWADFLGPVIYLSKTKLYPIPLALKLFSDPNTLSNWGAMFAMSVISLIPVLLIFLFFQRYIVEGISTSGLKG